MRKPKTKNKKLKTRILIVFIFSACGLFACENSKVGSHTVRFWSMGREGEVVQELIPEFEKENPGVHVEVQQMPWIAAHEKLLTAHVGNSTPDIAQVGNTWIPEFATLHALEDLSSRVQNSKIIHPQNYFEGIWKTNVLDLSVFGIPWYVDTRVIYYRKDLLAEAGINDLPKTWDEWIRAMNRIKRSEAHNRFAVLLPIDEWAQPVIFALQQDSEILKNGGRYAAVRDPKFRAAFEFYVNIFRAGLAPIASNIQIPNVFQPFARGDFVFYITGPWNIGEFRRRLPKVMEGKWATLPLPSPSPDKGYPGLSLAGGSSLVLFKNSENKELAWKFIEYLSRPEQQVRFFSASGDLPARLEAWKTPALANDSLAQAFYEQLQHVRPCPQVAEWEQIAQRIAEVAESAIRGQKSVEEALALMEIDINRMLEKRRWMLKRKT